MSKARREGELDLLRRVPIEANLEDLPWALVSSTKQGRNGIIRHSWQEEYVAADGTSRWSDHYWEVRESKGLGLPGCMEQDVYVALLELLEQRGGMPEDRTLWFSTRSLIKILGWPDSGTQYKRVKQALKCISSTTIDSRRAFYNPRLKKFVSDNFQLFTVHLSEAEDYEGETVEERNHLIFHPYFADSYRESYEGKLDTEFYWSLQSHVARRLYRLLDRRACEKREGGARTWEADLFEVRDLIPLSDYRYASKIKQILDKDAHSELRDKGFLRSVTYSEHKQGRSKRVSARYRISSAFEKRSFTRRTDLSDAQRDGVRQLQDIRVSRPVAEELVIRHGAERCLYWLDLLHYQDGIDWSKAAGLLVNAIRDEPERWEEVARRKGVGALGSSGDDRRLDSEGGKPASGDGHSDCARVGSDGGGDDTENRRVVPDADPEALEVWEKVLDDIAEEINAPSLRVWFEGTVPISLSPTSLTISVPNSFAKEYIEGRFLELLEGALQKRLSPTSVLEIVVATGGSTDNTNKRNAAGKDDG